ncbi:MAG: inverse autotransporter beta domain-containing protein [Gemmataceae bacterium]
MNFPRRTLLTLLAGLFVGAAGAAEQMELMGPPAPERVSAEIVPATPPPQLEPAPVEAVAAPAEVAPGGVLNDLFGRFLPRLGYSYDGLDTVGRDGGLSAFQLFLPVWQDRDASRIVFSDSRLLLFDSRGTVGANLGLGGRLFSESLGRTVGGYVYWDYSDTGRASFNQVSGGLETLGDRVDARANFYVPVGKDRKQTDGFFTANPEPYFQGNYLLVGGGSGSKFFEQALYGFDTEAGLKFLALEGLELRAFAGMYHYQGEAAQQAWGPRGRLEARVGDSVAMGVSIQNDRLFGTTVNFNCLLSYGRLSGRAYSDGPSAPLAASDRLGDPVVRVQHVAVDRQRQDYVVAGSPVIDPRTNQPFVFLHVAPGGNSDGSVENPYASLAGAFADPRFAAGNVVVFDRSGGAFSGNVTLAAGTQLLSSGPVQVLNTTGGAMVVPLTGTGLPLPKIHGTVMLASHATPCSSSTGAGRGRSSAPRAWRSATLMNNWFSGAGTLVWLPSIAGRIDLHDNQFLTPGGSAISLGTRGSDSANVSVRRNQITSPGGDGVAITASDASRVNATVEANAVRRRLRHRQASCWRPDRTAKATVNATVRDNQVSESGEKGSGGVALLTTGKAGGSRITATVTGNELADNHAPGFAARAVGPNTMALSLFDNKAISRHSMFGFLLFQQKKASFAAVDPATIGRGNTGSVTTAGTIADILTVPQNRPAAQRTGGGTTSGPVLP